MAKLKLNTNDTMVEIPIENQNMYKTRCELGIMIETKAFGTDEDDASRLTEQVVATLGDIFEKTVKRLCGDGVKITNIAARCTEVEEETV